MAQLLRIEWLKLKNYRTFWILGLLYLVSIFGINYIVFRIQQSIYEASQAKGVVEMVIGSPPYAFPEVWQMASFVSSFLLFLPGLLIIISITNEYSFKTHRQNIIDGWSRRQFITVKLLLAVVISIISTIMVCLTAVFFGLLSGGAFSVEKFQFILFFFIQALSYCMVALLFAILFRRGGLAIGVFFLYSLVLENLLGGLMNRYLNYSGRYLPLESTDNLIPLPAFENVKRQIVPDANQTVLLLFAIGYLAIYTAVAIKKFERDDL